MGEERIQLPLKQGHLMFHWQVHVGPTMNFSFVIFRGIQTSIAKELYSFVIFQGGGGGGGGGGGPDPCLHLWVCALI